MVSSKITQQVLLFLTLSASIAQISADTNSLDTTMPEVVSQIPEDQQKQNPFVAECHAYAQELQAIVGMIFNLNSSQGQKLVSTINPIMEITQPILAMPDTASMGQVYQSLHSLQQAIMYLNKTLEKGIANADEFNLEKGSRDQICLEDITTLIKEIDGSFTDLMVKINESYQDLWGKLIMHVRGQVLKLDAILQTTNTNISNNSNLINKEDIKKDIMELRNLLRQIEKEMATVSSNPEAVMMIYQINKAIINYLQDAQKTKFRKWVAFDLATEIRRSKGAPSGTLEETLMEITFTNFELDKLEKDAEKIDLTLTNKAARFVGDYIINPIERYDLDLLTLAIATTAGLGVYGAYSFDQTFATNPNSTLRKLFGYPDHFSGIMHEAESASTKTTETIIKFLPIIGMSEEEFIQKLSTASPSIATTHQERLSSERRRNFFMALGNFEARSITPGTLPISSFEKFIYDHKTGASVVGVTLFGLATWSIYKIWQKNKTEWTKKVRIWFDRLKGGAFAKTADKYDQILGSSVTFDHIIGLEYEKSLIYPHLKYIKDPERWDANELTPPTGILLTGPTRSGKTFFAKAICGELHKQNPDKTIRFITIDAHDIKAEGIASWMHVAKVLAPCVLFIDEIDLLGLQRSQDKTLLADFLQALSGIGDKDPKKQVIVIGTTNKPENIDTAMLQSGRLALEIRFRYPNMQERKEYIKKRLDKFAINPEMFEIDIDKLARETHEKSFEDIKLMIDTAFIHVGIKGSIISQSILEWALDTQLRKIIDIDQKQVSDIEKRTLAAHYAGQVLTQLLLNMDEKIAKVTIRQVVVKVKEESVYEQYYAQEKQKGIEQGALFTFLDHDTLDIKTQDEMAKKAKTLLGARIAERLITNSVSTLFGWKKNSAFNMVKSIVADGIDLKSLSKSGQNAVSDETQIKLKDFECEIESLLSQHMPALYALTDELQDKQTLTLAQIENIVHNAEGTINQAPEPVKEFTDTMEAIA